MANARKTLGSRAVGWVRVGGRRAAGAAQSFHFDVIFLLLLLYIYLFITLEFLQVLDAKPVEVWDPFRTR